MAENPIIPIGPEELALAPKMGKKRDYGKLIPCPNGKCQEHYDGVCQGHKRKLNPDGGGYLYTQCHQRRVKGRSVCRLHGGNGGRPPTTGEHTEVMKKLRSIPPRLQERALQNLLDPNLLNLGEMISTLYARADEMLGDLQGNPAQWDEMKSLVQAAKEAINAGNVQALVQALTDAEALGQQEGGQRKGWTEFFNLGERIRRMTETETRRRVQAENVMTIQEARGFVLGVINAIKNGVSNPVERTRVLNQVADFLYIGADREPRLLASGEKGEER